MKYSISRMTLLVAVTTALTACGGGGGGGGGSTFKKFDGTWNAACEAKGSKSFTQKWILNGESLDNDVEVWNSAIDCSSGIHATVKVKAKLDYKNEVPVANTCAGGKAQEVDITYTSLKIGSTTYTTEGQIKSLLASQDINTLPKYELLCKGADGKLYRGMLTADKNGSTKINRPTEMEPSHPLTP